MRTVFSMALTCALVAGMWTPAIAARQQATGGIQGIARDARQQTLNGYTVQIRNVQTGQLVGSGTTNVSGEFTFAELPAGSYVVEIVDAAGKIVGTTAPIAVAAGMTASVTVTASAAGALNAGRGAGFGIFGLGTAASAAIVGGVAVGIIAGVIAVARDASPSK